MQEPNRVVGHFVAPHYVEVIRPDDVQHHVIAAEYGKVDGRCSPSERVHDICPSDGSGDGPVIQNNGGIRVRGRGDWRKPGSPRERPVDRGVGKRFCGLRLEEPETNTA